MHILIVGAKGVGKSTLIDKLVHALNMPVWGFYTKKETHLANPDLGEPVYIYEADKRGIPLPENLVGYCMNQHATAYLERFNAFADTHLQAPPASHVIVMDEIGFMESKAAVFREAILKLLDGDSLTIAAVKDKDTDFLTQVRTHPNCKCFYITIENRDEMFDQVIAYIFDLLSQ